LPILRIDAKGKAPTRILWQGLHTRHRTPPHIADFPSAPMRDGSLSVIVDTLVRLKSR
jgi:hypothetical protein